MSKEIVHGLLCSCSMSQHRHILSALLLLTAAYSYFSITQQVRRLTLMETDRLLLMLAF